MTVLSLKAWWLVVSVPTWLIVVNAVVGVTCLCVISLALITRD